MFVEEMKKENEDEQRPTRIHSLTCPSGVGCVESWVCVGRTGGKTFFPTDDRCEDGEKKKKNISFRSREREREYEEKKPERENHFNRYT